MAQRQQKQNQRTVEGGSLAFAEYGKRLQRFESLHPLWRWLSLHRRLQRAQWTGYMSIMRARSAK